MAAALGEEVPDNEDYYALLNVRREVSAAAGPRRVGRAPGSPVPALAIGAGRGAVRTAESDPSGRRGPSACVRPRPRGAVRDGGTAASCGARGGGGPEGVRGATEGGFFRSFQFAVASEQICTASKRGAARCAGSAQG